MIGYTPRMGALQRETYNDLLDLGFNPPPFPASDVLTPVLNMVGMVPESDPVEAVAFRSQESGVDEGDYETVDQAVQNLQTLQDDIIDRFQERAQHLRELLAEEEVIAAEFAQIGSMAREEVEEANAVIQDMLRDAQRGIDRAAEAADAKFLMMAGSPENLLEDVGDIEKYLSELSGDLGTTITVPLEQVKDHMPKWIPAISKELNNVEEAHKPSSGSPCIMLRLWNEKDVSSLCRASSCSRSNRLLSPQGVYLELLDGRERRGW